MFRPNDEAVSRSVSNWMEKLDRHDPSLLAHAVMVAQWSMRLGVRIGMDRERLQRLKAAAILHDIGKLTIPAALLSKPEKLVPEELKLMRNHAAAGYEMLLEEGIHPSEILDVVRFHHERLDGSGYPCALKGEQIDQNVRIVMICDIYAALRENRPYNRPMDWMGALKRMSEKSFGIDMGLFKIFTELAVSIETKHQCDESMILTELRTASVP